MAMASKATTVDHIQLWKVEFRRKKKL